MDPSDQISYPGFIELHLSLHVFALDNFIFILSLLSRLSFWFVCEHPHGEEVKAKVKAKQISFASQNLLRLRQKTRFTRLFHLRRTLTPSELNTRALRSTLALHSRCLFLTDHAKPSLWQKPVYTYNVLCAFCSALAAKLIFLSTSAFVLAFSKASLWNSIVFNVPSIWASCFSNLFFLFNAFKATGGLKTKFKDINIDNQVLVEICKIF